LGAIVVVVVFEVVVVRISMVAVLSHRRLAKWTTIALKTATKLDGSQWWHGPQFGVGFWYVPLGAVLVV
jgi:hypothetical protein